MDSFVLVPNYFKLYMPKPRNTVQRTFWTSIFLTSWFRKETCFLLLSKVAFFFSGFMHWTYETIQYHLNHWGLLPSSWKSYFIQWHFLSKSEKTMILPYIMGTVLRNTDQWKRLLYLIAVIKPIRLLNISKKGK